MNAFYSIFFSLYLLALYGCKTESTDTATLSSQNCRGEYTVIDTNGLVRQRFNEYQSSIGCLTDPIQLTQWEKTTNDRFDKKISCTPQPDLPSMWLKSSGNYYSYRNSKIYIELNAAKGEAKRLIVGEMPDGSPSYQRQIFCYYVRTDLETESTNPHNYGAMILFDLELSASSNIFSPMEIFNYSVSGNNFLMTKMDDNTGLDWTWCPGESVPWGFCDYNKNGNEFFFPSEPSASVQSQLQAEAILIRSEFNFSNVSQSTFETMWNSSPSLGVELGTSIYANLGGKWKYTVSNYLDEPLYVGREWRKYLRRERPSMPDVASASSMGMPYVCYSATKEITYNDGSKGTISGQACYDQNGDYSFTQ